MSPAPKNKSVLVACSLVRYARHTQTVNLYAPLTLRFGLTHDRPCVQVWSGGRLSPVRGAGHVHVCRTHAFRSVQVGASMDLYRYCIEDLRVHTSSVAARSARPPRSYRVRHRRLELWTAPPQQADRPPLAVREDGGVVWSSDGAPFAHPVSCLL